MRSFVHHSILAAVVTISIARGQVAPGVPAEASPNAGSSAPSANAPASQAFRFQPNGLPHRAALHYELFWGVDSLSVRSAESGELIRFSYHILDPDKAKSLNDKKLEPTLIDPQAGVRLVIPSLEKVGQLRQSGTPVAGKSYWMAFSNKGRFVKPGDRVTVVIGNFRAEGLVVQ